MLPVRPAPRQLTAASLAEGTRTLCAVDRHLAEVVDRFGAPPLWARRPGFATLVRIILEQQVSLASARALCLRLAARTGGVTPAAVDALGVGGLRQLGLTGQKAAYCEGLARLVNEGALNLTSIARMPDAEGRERLLRVRGLGPWSVDIYLLMALRRPDVWPAGDLALAVAMQRVKKLRRRPDAVQQARVAARWTPYRSVAARILWHHYLSAPSSRS